MINIKIVFSDASELVKELSDDHNKTDIFELEAGKEIEWIKIIIRLIINLI